MNLAATAPKQYLFKDIRQKFESWLNQHTSKSTPAHSVRQFSCPIPETDILKELIIYPTEHRCYWQNRDATEEWGTWEKAVEFIGTNNNECAKNLQEISKLLVDPQITCFCGLAFDPNNINLSWKNFSAGFCFLPRFAIGRQHDHYTFYCYIRPGELTPFSVQNLLTEFDHIFKTATHPQDISNNNLRFIQHSPQKEQWVGMVHHVLDEIRRENLKKVVLARQSLFELNQTLDPFLLLPKIKKSNPHCFIFCYAPQPDEAFLGASPERLFSRSEKQITSEALAGTRPRSKSTSQDQKLGEELLSSEKDRHEQHLVVEFLKAKLTPMTQHLNIDDSAKLLKLREGQHLVSNLQGELTSTNIKDADILTTLHPTPAVAGTPTQSALTMIARLENFSRGLYAGAIGTLSQNKSELAVGIRSARLQGKSLAIFAGAGIVQGSQPEAEWEEIENKMNSLLKAL